MNSTPSSAEELIRRSLQNTMREVIRQQRDIRLLELSNVFLRAEVERLREQLFATENLIDQEDPAFSESDEE